MKERLFVAIAPLLVIALLVTGGAPIYWPVALATVVVASIVIPLRFTVTTFGALMAMIAAAAPPILWARATTTEVGLALPVALSLLGIAAVRPFLDTRRFGRTFDRTMVGLACIAEGHGVKSTAYPYVAVLVGVILVVDHGGGLRSLRSIVKSPRVATVVMAVAATLAAIVAISLPAIDRATNRRFRALYEGRIRKTAFSAHVRLDQPGLVNRSDELVLRLHGVEADYLRGAVFDTFDGSYWTTSRRPRRSEAAPVTTDVTYVESLESSSFLFVPRGAKIASDTSYVTDGLGAIRSGETRGATSWAFARTQEPDDPATDADLALPKVVLDDVRPLALAWTEGATDDRAKIDALGHHFASEFAYTLDRPAPAAGVSPLHDFLFVHREGHCEFFASALVVLARSLGIPARLVAGFRVVEHNGYGGYAVVRAEHAHAWAEVLVPKRDDPKTLRFETYDATPPGDPLLTAGEDRDAAALFDYVKWAVKRVYDAAFENPSRSIPILAAIIAAALFVRWLSNRRTRGAGSLVPTEAPVPASLVAFEAMLAERGFSRAPSETLEELARRLDQAEHGGWARALRRYAVKRYGADAPEEALASALEAD